MNQTLTLDPQTSAAVGLVMTEHAAWLPGMQGCQRIFSADDSDLCLAHVAAHGWELQPLTAAASQPAYDTFTLPTSLDLPAQLRYSLRSLGTVVRFRNSYLWDAIGLAIIRQVIRAAQSKKLYRTFCQSYGQRIALPDGGSYSLFPSPQTVLQVEKEQFRCVGMAFKARPLQAAAAAYLERGQWWCSLPPLDLVEELQTVPRIGPWTARAAVADWSNDWALYPYADLAVRTWAGRAAPAYNWPTDEPGFAHTWHTLASEHLSTLTLLTLAWGSQRGDIG